MHLYILPLSNMLLSTFLQIEDRNPRKQHDFEPIQDYDFQDHIGPLALGCGKIVIVFGALLVATFSLF